MDKTQSEIKPVLIVDLSNHPIGDYVVVYGIVEKQSGYRKNIKGVLLKDITGKILSIIDTAKDPIAPRWNPESVWVGSRIKMTGRLMMNSKGVRVLTNISDIQVILSPKTRMLSELNPDMHELASSILISKINHKVNEIMLANSFVEFSSRLLSNIWFDDGLEPMKVLYQGFGSPAFLTPSPSPQIIEFLTTSLITRAFTITTSFSQTYRFPNSPSEMSVIVAKASDMSLDSQIKLLRRLSVAISKMFIETSWSFTIHNGIWPDEIEGVQFDAIRFTDDLNLIKYSTNIPIVGKNWNAHANIIIHLLDKDKNILAEGTREYLSNEVEISTLTIYPSQFLGMIEKAPCRRLQNLMKVYDDGKK